MPWRKSYLHNYAKLLRQTRYSSRRKRVTGVKQRRSCSAKLTSDHIRQAKNTPATVIRCWIANKSSTGNYDTLEWDLKATQSAFLYTVLLAHIHTLLQYYTTFQKAFVTTVQLEKLGLCS